MLLLSSAIFYLKACGFIHQTSCTHKKYCITTEYKHLHAIPHKNRLANFPSQPYTATCWGIFVKLHTHSLEKEEAFQLRSELHTIQFIG